ncbi:MAG: hypothetical protein WC650_05630 [Candidatus Doudnabacteria bacterium]
MDNNTLFNEEDDKKGKDSKKDEIEDELNLEEGEEDIIPIEETGGGGRKILWTIVILIIIGLGIYSFAKREQIRESLKNQTGEDQTGELGAASETTLEKFTWENQDQNETANKEATSVQEEDNKIVATETEPPKLEEFTVNEEKSADGSTDKTTEAKEEVTTSTAENTPPAIESQEDKFVVAAQKGEGITNLSRRALKEYLDKTNRGGELNAEQKIYIEDYLQNKTGTERLGINETRTFTVGLVEESINAAKQLNEKQLKNLEKYSKLVYSE